MFDFFKKKKETPAAPDNTPVAESTATPVEAPTADVDRTAPDKEFFANDSYAVSLRRATVRYLRENDGVFEAEHMLNLINAVVDVETVRVNLETRTWKQAKDGIATAEKSEAVRLAKMAVAETAFRIDGLLQSYTNDYLCARVRETEDIETLLKAFIALDFGVQGLKPEASVNLRYLQNEIMEEARRRGVVVKGPFETLQERCYAAFKESPQADETKALAEELFRALQTRERLYVAYDEDFNANFPFITYDGRAALFTNEELAVAFTRYIADKQLGHAKVGTVEKADYAAFFERLYTLGVNVFRLDDGRMPVDIWFEKLIDTKKQGLLDDVHRETRGLFLRELQYGYRLQKSGIDIKTEAALVPKERMLMMRFNGYRMIGGGLLYVLAPKAEREQVTYYTQSALKKASSMLERLERPKAALVADGDNAYSVYDKPHRLRVVQLPGQDMKQSFVCAFTQKAVAEDALANFRKHGVDDSIVVMTWDEIAAQAMQCAGVMLDLPTYGRQLKKEEFAEVAKFGAFDKPIVINMKQKPDEEQ